MANITSIASIELHGAVVAHHCDHTHIDATTWRIDTPNNGGNSAYLTGTVDELEAFGRSALAAVAERRALVERDLDAQDFLDTCDVRILSDS